ncbi:MAG: MFS transporter [Vampirovibrionales bacterium]|nr:MFS transporter [Vampirovibrionales bacterium]
MPPSLQTPVSPLPEVTHAPSETGYRALLKNKKFLALWLGQIFSQIGDRIIFVVFVALIVKYFGASDRYNSYLYIAFTIPAILLTSIAGVFVDRWPRRATLVLTNVLRALCVLLLPLASMGASWIVFTLAFLISTATQFFVPAEAATIPNIVSKKNLMVANSLFTTTMMASVIFGFALGDPLINIFTLERVHWAISALFLLSSICLLFVKVPLPPKVVSKAAPTLKNAFAEFGQEIQEGVSYIKAHPMVRNGILKLAVLFSTIVAVCIVSIAFAKAYLFSDPQVAARKFAYIVTFSGIGMALGAFAVGSSCRHMKRGFLVYGGFLVIGASLALLAAVQWIPQKEHIFMIPRLVTAFIYLDEVHFTMRMLYTYSLAVVMGFAAAFVAIPLQALLHELIPDEIRGKVLGVQFTLLSTCSTVPVLLAGIAVEQVGVRDVLLCIGIPLTLLGLIGLVFRIRQFRIQQALVASKQKGASAHHVASANW